MSKNVRRAIKGSIKGNDTAFDLRRRRVPGFLGEEPRLGKTASIFGARDAPGVHRDAQVVADAAADGTSDVVNGMGHIDEYTSPEIQKGNGLQALSATSSERARGFLSKTPRSHSELVGPWP